MCLGPILEGNVVNRLAGTVAAYALNVSLILLVFVRYLHCLSRETIQGKTCAFLSLFNQKNILATDSSAQVIFERAK